VVGIFPTEAAIARLRRDLSRGPSGQVVARHGFLGFVWSWRAAGGSLRRSAGRGRGARGRRHAAPRARRARGPGCRHRPPRSARSGAPGHGVVSCWRGSSSGGEGTISIGKDARARVGWGFWMRRSSPRMTVEIVTGASPPGQGDAGRTAEFERIGGRRKSLGFSKAAASNHGQRGQRAIASRAAAGRAAAATLDRRRQG
jgi:hypothetical protein